MSLTDLHPWDLSPEAAIQVQAGLRPNLILHWERHQVYTIGGVAVRLKGNHARAVIVVISYPDLTPLEASTTESPLVSCRTFLARSNNASCKGPVASR